MVNFKPGISVQGSLATTWVFSALEIVVVGLRLYIQLYLKRLRLNSSDYLVILALVLSIVGNALITRSFEISQRLEPTDILLFEEYLETLFLCTIFYWSTLYAVKASLLTLYFNLFKQIADQTRVTILFRASAVYLFCCFGIALFTSLFACGGHVESQWKDWPHICVDGVFLWYFVLLSVLSLTSDLLLMSIPLVLLRMLTQSRRTRNGALFVIGIGGLSIVANAVRTAGVGPTVSTRFLDFEESLQVIRTIDFWSVLEGMFAFIAVCMPSFRIFLRQTKGTSSSSSARPLDRSQGLFGNGNSDTPHFHTDSEEQKITDEVKVIHRNNT